MFEIIHDITYLWLFFSLGVVMHVGEIVDMRYSKLSISLNIFDNPASSMGIHGVSRPRWMKMRWGFDLSSIQGREGRWNGGR